MGPWQSEPCGRPTRRGTPCPRSRNAMTEQYGPHIFLSPACAWHLAEEERAQRQAILEMQDAARKAAEPACWHWPIPRGDYRDDPEGKLFNFQQGRCGI